MMLAFSRKSTSRCRSRIKCSRACPPAGNETCEWPYVNGNATKEEKNVYQERHVHVLQCAVVTFASVCKLASRVGVALQYLAMDPDTASV